MTPQTIEGWKHVTKNLRVSGNVLEIGPIAEGPTVLRNPCFDNCTCFGLDRRPMREPSDKRYKPVQGDSNSLPFENNFFDCIVSESVMEHDHYFWLTVAEYKRCLKPGGLLMVGVPAFMRKKALTFPVHGQEKNYPEYGPDHYRFSQYSVEKIIFEGYQNIQSHLLFIPKPEGKVPYIICKGVLS